jgi:hypothetical protein
LLAGGGGSAGYFEHAAGNTFASQPSHAFNSSGHLLTGAPVSRIP